MFQRILVPIDLSEKSWAAVDLAYEFASQSGAEVILIHVIETIEHVQFQDTGVVVRNFRVAEENRAHAPAGRAEEIRPVTLNLAVLQQIQAETVRVEAQAGLQVADRHHGMMNSPGHGPR